MKKHHTTVLLFVLFFTGLIVLWWADYAEVPTNEELNQRSGLVFPDLRKTSASDIRRIEVVQGAEKAAKEKRLVFERRGDGWQMLEPVNAPADPSRIEHLARNLKDLRKSPEAGTITATGAKYGLEPPLATVSAFGTDARVPLAILEVGKSIRDKLYVRPGGGPGIDVVDALLFKGVDQPAPDWRDRALFNLATFQVGGLKVSGPGRDLSAQRREGQWRILSPVRTLADDLKIENALAELTSLQVADGARGFVANDVRDRAPYGLDDRSAVRIELAPALRREAPQVLLVGKPAPDHPDDLYAMRGDQDDVVRIPGKAIRDLGKEPNLLRSQKVVDIKPAQVDFVRVVAFDTTFSLARTSTAWEVLSPVREQADIQAVPPLLSRLETLQTHDFLKPSQVPKAHLDPPILVLSGWQSPVGTAPPAAPMPEPKGKPAFELRIGRHDPLRKTVYAQVPGDEQTVLALPDSILEVLPKDRFAFRNRTLLSLSPGQVERLVVTRDGQTIEVVPDSSGRPNHWKMTAPIVAEADDAAVTRSLLALSNLRADAFITDRPGADKAYGLDAPTLTVTWATAPEASKSQELSRPSSRTLKVGTKVPKTDRSFAVLGDSPLVFTLPEAVLEPFRLEFRNPLVVSFPLARVKRLGLHWPGRTLKFFHQPSARGAAGGWTPEPGTEISGFDLSRVAPLAKDLSHFQAKKFVQYRGPFSPAMGLSDPRFAVSAQIGDEPESRLIRVGNAAAPDDFYATTEKGDEGGVFLVAGKAWANLVEARGGEELPADVFAPANANANPPR